MPPFLRRWLPLLSLLGVAALAIYLLQPPRPLPATAPAEVFAAARAQPDLDSLARQPHALGTAAHRRVQAYLLRRLRALGLHPRVQDTTLLLLLSGMPTLARVQNIVARQPGRQPGGPAVLVAAHYDSQPHTPGAGDDGAAVAAMLETIRALRAGPPLAHDVQWLLTDAEEAGMLGARAYAADTARLRRTVGLVLNFEGRGNAGPSLTFEVSARNGWLLREYAAAAPYPIASSLFYEAYRYLPNYTDFTELRAANTPGLNFAFVGGFPYYHSPADTPARLSLASVQHHGSYMLSLVRHFASIPLVRPNGPDYTFFNPLGPWLVRYPAGWNQVLLAAATVLLVLAAALAQHQRRLSWLGLLGGALAWVGGLLLTLLAGWGLLAAVRALYPAYLAFYDGTFYNAWAYQVALLALGLAVLGFYYAWLGQWVRPEVLIGGALLAVGLLAGAMAGAAPSSGYLLGWPLLAAGVAWAGRVLVSNSRHPAAAAVNWADWLLALPAVALLSQTAFLVLETFGLGTAVLASILLLAVLLGLLLPLLLPVLRQPALQPSRQRGSRPSLGLPLLGLALSAGALAGGHFTHQPTSAQPQQTHLYYYLDAQARQAYWLSALPHPDSWTRQVLRNPQLGSPRPELPSRRWQPAPVLPLAPPQVQVLADTVRAGHRYLRLRLRAGQPASISLRLRLPGLAAGLLAVRVAEQPVPSAWLSRLATPGLLLLAPRAGGEVLEVTCRPGFRLPLELLSRSLGLPPAPGLPPLPATYVPMPGYHSFTTQISQRLAL